MPQELGEPVNRRHKTRPVRQLRRLSPVRGLLLAAGLCVLSCSENDTRGSPGTSGVAGIGLSGSAGAGVVAGGNSGGPGGMFGSSGTSATSGSAGAAGAPSTGGTGGTSASGSAGAAGAPSTGGTSNAAGTSQGGVAGVAGGPGNAGASAMGGSAGMSGSSGAAGANFSAPFFLGADISSVQESNTTYRDTDGQNKSIFALLRNHGFNYIRLKTFVEPTAPYGYASTANGCTGFPEAFGDRDHVVAFGRLAKSAGMGFLLNFHYSDVWADPGNQIIPRAWRNAASITELAALLKAYTKDVLTTAIDAGARPDMVQVGNEITPGMLMHVPGPNTDCWGNNPENAPVGGSVSNWNNLATLLKAGIEAVREVDSSIQVMLHVENTDHYEGVRSWVENAVSRDVNFDILGLSCYSAFQGQPSVWENTFQQLATDFPELKFVIAEYNPERTRANLIMKNMANGRGLGTFFWEPTRSGEWGSSLFDFQGGVAVANSSAFGEFDSLLPQLGLR